MESFLPAPAGSAVGLAWLVPVVPAFTAGVILLFGRRLGRASAGLAILAIGVSAVLSTVVFTNLLGQPEEERAFLVDVATWISAGDLDVRWSLLVDPLSSIMLLLVTWVGLLIHVYAVGYMSHDPRFTTFFAYLNLFAASMLVLVLGSGFLTLFVGWELVGLCSYLLIGFWFSRRDYAAAAKKAFVTNRIGDVGFLIAMFVVFATFGSLEFAEVLPAVGTAATGTLVAVGLLLLVGATGKSAQIPLYVWLPDAMAGPTPVSALIHAATMVTAGVYLIARLSPLYAAVPDVGLVAAWVGGITALVAAMIACAETDMKRVLAFSTISQLGYMFIAVGVGDYTAGVFHLLTHGFFKALLFLTAGSVMHAMGDRTDLRVMGGLWRRMPITAWTALAGTAAIAGAPFLSGFYSKEEILASAGGTAGGELLWVLALLTALLTAFYMTRWFVLIFTGDQRWAALPDAPHPHESPPSMTVPLLVLAAGSLAGGLLNTSPDSGFLHGWLEPSVVAFEHSSEIIPESVFLPAALAVAGLGAAGAWWLYRSVDMDTVGAGGGARRLARRGFYVDRAYETVVMRPGAWLARGSAAFDRGVVDGAVDGLATAVAGLASAGRRLQTGFVRSYALAILSGAVLLAVVFAAALVVA